ncbi:MAG: CBS domain-containing protein [Phycisphaerales bacterium]
MKVRELVNKQIRPISASAMICEAAERMSVLGVDALPIVENQEIVGIVVARDIAPETLADDTDPHVTPVRNAMRPGAACCSEDDDIDKAITTMETSQVRRLIVLDSRGKAVGVLSDEDLTSKASERSHPESLMEGENHESPRD